MHDLLEALEGSRNVVRGRTNQAEHVLAGRVGHRLLLFVGRWVHQRDGRPGYGCVARVGNGADNAAYVGLREEWRNAE